MPGLFSCSHIEIKNNKIEINRRKNANGFKVYTQNMKFVTEKDENGVVLLGLLTKQTHKGSFFQIQSYFSESFSQEKLLTLCYKLTTFFQMPTNCAHNIVTNDPICAEALIKHWKLIRDENLLYEITETGTNFWHLNHRKTSLKSTAAYQFHCGANNDVYNITMRYLSLGAMLHKIPDQTEKNNMILAIRTFQNESVLRR